MAVIVGAATHVGWDEFTHPGRFGTEHIPALAAEYPSPIGPLAGFRWAQYASGVVGLLVLVWVGWRQAVVAAPPRRHVLLARWAPAVTALAAVVAVALRLLPSGLGAGLSARALAFEVITASISGGCLALLALCVATRLRPGDPDDAG